MKKRAFDFLPSNKRDKKPRKKALTEVRGPYYTAIGKNYLSELFESFGDYIDSLKFAGGSFTLLPKKELLAIIDLAHKHHIAVSTGGFIERVLTHGHDMVDRYLEECHDLGFDIIEISSGFISLPLDDWLQLIEKVKKMGLKAKPEVGIQFGAGGATSAKELALEGTKAVSWAIAQAKRFLDAGADIIMIESEGITENVDTWRTDAVAQIIDHLNLENVMFEAADPEVFSWYITNYGPDVNLFVDHSQIVQLESLREGNWGTKSTWGRIVTY